MAVFKSSWSMTNSLFVSVVCSCSFITSLHGLVTSGAGISGAGRGVEDLVEFVRGPGIQWSK